MKIYFDDKICCVPDLNALLRAVSRTNRSIKFLTLVTSALFIYVVAHNSNERLINKSIHNRLINIDDKIRKFVDKNKKSRVKKVSEDNEK